MKWLIIAVSLFLSNKVMAQSCDLSITRVAAISNIPYVDVKQLRSEFIQSIDTSMSLNEFEPASFIIVNNGTSPCEDIMISIGDFYDDLSIQNNLIETDIKIVKRWYQEGGGWKTIGRQGDPVFIPELLVNDDEVIKTDKYRYKNYLKIYKSNSSEYIDISEHGHDRGRVVHSIEEYNVKDSDSIKPFTIGANNIRQIWLTFHTKSGSKFGKYSTAITINDSQKIIHKIPVNVDILPLVLDEASILYSIFYRGKLVAGDGTVSSEYKSENQFVAELTNMKNHGICCPLIYQGLDNKDLFEKNMSIRKNVFGDDMPAYIVSLSASLATNKNNKKYLSKNINYLKQNKDLFSVSDYYLFGKDEAKGHKLVSQKESWQYVKNNGVNIFTTGYKGTYDKVGDILDLLVLSGKPHQAEIDKFHAVGKKIFSYGYPQSGPEDPLLFRKNFGLKIWQRSIDGVMPYAYHDSYRSVWNDFDHKIYRDHNFTYPSVNGVFDTLAWEGFREGVDDVRYISTLQNILKKLTADIECRENEQCSKAVASAYEELKAIRTSSLKDLDAIRQSIAQHIIELNRFK